MKQLCRTTGARYFHKPRCYLDLRCQWKRCETIIIYNIEFYIVAPQGIEIWAGDPRGINLTTNQHSRVGGEGKLQSKNPDRSRKWAAYVASNRLPTHLTMNGHTANSRYCRLHDCHRFESSLAKVWLGSNQKCYKCLVERRRRRVYCTVKIR
jgi:hypothetical protein